ncbi:polysaccharide deacetylase family protein [Nonomuraea sp. NPDC046802]|uniref:polysaccharide deacetylase family protein n=1 Tax=Nonomuraea sp. NPDC046802 TaxID=3154919 RepID=UPI0033DB2B43
MTLTGSIINLTVHGIGDTDRPLDPGEDTTWVSVEQFERVLDAVVDRGDVHITFDDGNASDVEIALPRLLERGLRGEFFLLAGMIGEQGRVTTEGVTELVRSGMRIGSHGWGHRDWRQLDPGQVDEELSGARRVIGRLCGHPVTTVAIPFGSYDRHVLGRLRETGVTCAYTSDGGRATPGAWLQARNSLRHDLDDGWIHHVLDDRPPLAHRARKAAARFYKRARG